MKLKYRRPWIRACSIVAMGLVVTVTLPAVSCSHEPATTRALLEQFQNTQFFWEQFELAQRIVALHDRSVLPSLAPYLSNEDRHLRGNAAFVFARLGDDKGFDVIVSILNDRSWRPEGQGGAVVIGFHGSDYDPAPQIRSDRYYAAHLLGDLKDPRAVPILVPLLTDEDVNYIVPWSLGEIGDQRAVAPLIKRSTRVVSTAQRQREK